METRRGTSTSKMAPGEHAARVASPIGTPQLPLLSLLPPSSLSCSDSEDRPSDVSDTLGDKDFCSHILSVPTKADLERIAHRVEKVLRQDIEALQADTAHIGGRVEALETQWEETTPAIQALTEM